MRSLFAILSMTALVACGSGGGDNDNAAAPAPPAQAAPAPADAAAGNATEAAAGPAPSFDCAAASSAVERMICADPELSALDRGLALFYASARRTARAGEIGREQRDWLRDRRDRCTTPQCLREAMTEHMWNVALVAGDEIPEYRSDPVHGRLKIAELGQGWYGFGVLALHYQGPEAIHDAGASGAFRLEGGRGILIGADNDCTYTLIRLPGDRWQVIEEPPPSGTACGGLNATVAGVYTRLR